MVESTWHRIELPILEAVAEAEISGQVLSGEEIASATGLSLDVASAALDRLEQSRYVEGVSVKPWGQVSHWRSIHLMERGRREVGLWPSDDPVEAFVEALNAVILRTTDVDERTRLEKIRDLAGGVSKAAMTAVVSGAVNSVMGG